MKKRTAARIISFSLAAVLVSAVISIKTYIKSRDYFLDLEREYAYSLDEFSAGINNIALTLKKAQYVNTPSSLNSMAAKLLCDAEICKNAISKLPDGNRLVTLNKFLSQVGNYALSISDRLIKNEEKTDEDKENINKLRETAEKIAGIVTETGVTYNNTEYWTKELNSKINHEADVDSISASLGVIDDELTDYPTLIYDGPYSDHILEKEPEMLKNAQPISQEKGLEIASKLSQYDKKFVKSDGVISGDIPSYRYAGEGFTAAVSKNGGYPVFMRKERIINESDLNYARALEKAKRYLGSLGLYSFTETYFSVNEGVCLINMAYVHKNTICYTDLIKVGVAMDNGEIMIFEASGYISNHKEREFETPLFSVREAEMKLNPSLTVTAKALALIPTNGRTEMRCYEFACKTEDGDEILVYLNTETLAEEDILILQKSDGGILVK